MLGASGVLLVPRFGIGESPSSVNTDENWLLRTSAFPLASPTVLPSFFSDATPELSHFLFLTNEYSFFLLLEERKKDRE